MPISLDQWDNEGREISEVQRGHRQVQVLAIFKARPDEAFSQAEIANEMNSQHDLTMSPQQARQICRALVTKKALAMRAVTTLNVTRYFYALSEDLRPAKPAKKAK